MPDRFSTIARNLTTPLTNSEIIDASSADHEFTNPTRAILFTGAGEVTMRLTGDSSDLTVTVSAGTFLPLRVSHIRMGSAATGIGFW